MCPAHDTPGPEGPLSIIVSTLIHQLIRRSQASYPFSLLFLASLASLAPSGSVLSVPRCQEPRLLPSVAPHGKTKLPRRTRLHHQYHSFPCRHQSSAICAALFAPSSPLSPLQLLPSSSSSSLVPPPFDPQPFPSHFSSSSPASSFPVSPPAFLYRSGEFHRLAPFFLLPMLRLHSHFIPGHLPLVFHADLPPYSPTISIFSCTLNRLDCPCPRSRARSLSVLGWLRQ